MNEREIAEMEGEMNHAEDAYFDARTELDILENRKVFQAAFDRGYRARDKTDHRTESRVEPLEMGKRSTSG